MTDLELRMAAVVRRIGDAQTIERVGAALTSGDAVVLFALLSDADAGVVAAAHECAVLRFARLAAVAARAFGFDEFERDELVQRTFLDLPAVVRRARARHGPIEKPEAWLRRRAYLVASQMLREERGRRVTRDAVAAATEPEEDVVLRALELRSERARLDAAIADLARERPLWAEVLRRHYFGGLGLEEIAKQLKRSHGTVRNDAQRARARLAAIIRERYPELIRSNHASTERANAMR